jgi:hypothetical protein
MIFSKFNPSIQYDESTNIFPSDLNQLNDLYKIEIFNQTIIVTIGNANETYLESSDFVFFPIYLLNEKEESLCIGLFEVAKIHYDEISIKEIDNIIPFFYTPLLFSFVTETYLKETSKKEKDIVIVTDENKNKDDDTEILHQSKIIPYHFLQEETKEDMITIQKKFHTQSSKKLVWIQSFFQNMNYSISQQPQCFFQQLSFIFSTIGYEINEIALKSYLIENMKEDEYQEYKKMYSEYETLLIHQTSELKKLKAELKKKVDQLKEQEKEQKQDIVTNPNNKIDLTEVFYAEIKVKQIRDQLIGIQFIKNIQNVTQLKEYISANNCFNDEIILQLVEKKLDIQCIIVTNISNTKTIDKLKWDTSIEINNHIYSILKSRLKKSSSSVTMFSPKYFIVLEQVGNKFRPISYHDKMIFTFLELPFDLRLLLIEYQENSVYSNNMLIYEFYDEINK